MTAKQDKRRCRKQGKSPIQKGNPTEGKEPEITLALIGRSATVHEPSNHNLHRGPGAAHVCSMIAASVCVSPCEPHLVDLVARSPGVLHALRLLQPCLSVFSWKFPGFCRGNKRRRKA